MADPSSVPGGAMALGQAPTTTRNTSVTTHTPSSSSSSAPSTVTPSSTPIAVTLATTIPTTSAHLILGQNASGGAQILVSLLPPSSSSPSSSSSSSSLPALILSSSALSSPSFTSSAPKTVVRSAGASGRPPSLSGTTGSSAGLSAAIGSVLVTAQIQASSAPSSAGGGGKGVTLGGGVSAVTAKPSVAKTVVMVPGTGKASASAVVGSAHATPPTSGGHGAGKPSSFAALMAAEPATSPAGQASGKKHGSTSARKAQPSKPASTASKVRAPVDPAPQPTRSSQRNVKRPKTYDEELADLEMAASKAAKKAKGSRSSKVTPKKANRPKSSGAVKDLGRWRPPDDLMLISAVQQTNDLAAVHLAVKFSCRFSLKEVEERWYALLYDPQISKIAVEAMRSLHPGVVTMALNNALWSKEEEAVLAKIPSTDSGHLELFQKLLRDNPCVFHICRTATSLHHHWVLMGHYGLLHNQKVEFIPPGDSLTTFTDAEEQIKDAEITRLRDVKEEALEQELMISDRHAKREILKLEEELPKWRTIIDTGEPPEFGSGVLAVLKGKVVEFLMTSREVTVGRGSPAGPVDFDLSLEGPSFKISRRQATIYLSDEGEFVVRNEGRRPLYLSGKPLLSGKHTHLQHQQVLEVTSLSFQVLLNTKLAASMVAKAPSRSASSAQT